MASERCATCGDARNVGHEFGFRDHAFVCPKCGEEDCEHSTFAPAPREAGAILTREDFRYDAEHGCVDKLLAHDAALRAEVERLTRERDEAQERLDAAEGEGDTLEADNVLYQKQCVAWKARADAAEAEIERLRTGHPWDEAEQKVRADLIAERDAAYMLVIEAGRERKAAESERDRLKSVLEGEREEREEACALLDKMKSERDRLRALLQEARGALASHARMFPRRSRVHPLIERLDAALKREEENRGK